MDNKIFIGTIGILLAGFFGLLIANSGDDATPSTQNFNEATALEVQDSDYPSETSSDNPVVFVEYGDFECPACRAAYPFVNQAKEEFKDDAVFVFRHFPLTSIHPNAITAHRAAEAAGMQGKFIEFHDKLYEQQAVWSGSNDVQAEMERFASELGLNVEQFNTDRNSQAVFDVINAQRDVGNQLGITGTPTFFIDGQEVDLALTNYQDYQTAIQNAIDAKNTSSADQNDSGASEPTEE